MARDRRRARAPRLPLRSNHPSATLRSTMHTGRQCGGIWALGAHTPCSFAAFKGDRRANAGPAGLPHWRCRDAAPAVGAGPWVSFRSRAGLLCRLRLDRGSGHSGTMTATPAGQSANRNDGPLEAANRLRTGSPSGVMACDLARGRGSRLGARPIGRGHGLSCDFGEAPAH
jgi:hypothetical protein